MGSLRLVQIGFSERALLAWDGLLSVAFFAQHSGMVRKSFRARLSQAVPVFYQGAVYTIVSGVVLVVLVTFWQSSGTSVYELQGVSYRFSRVLFFLAMAGFAWGVVALRSFDTFGLRPIRDHLHGRSPQAPQFTLRGPYRWVRHPLYFFTLILIWSCPVMTSDRLLFNILWTVWIYAGTVLEERDLVQDLGDDYRAYQNRVPMLVPWRLPS
jgi:protein-S-isoprenylcysteine O-methyltransferase Ste14